jgi:hypothetical protein
MEYYRRARFVVAFSNLAAPAKYTHPTKAYFTGRWTDALANGAVVAGIHPVEDAGVGDLLWDGALLSFDRIDLAENIEVTCPRRPGVDARYRTSQPPAGA